MALLAILNPRESAHEPQASMLPKRPDDIPGGRSPRCVLTRPSMETTTA
jgi:hypothetical protein